MNGFWARVMAIVAIIVSLTVMLIRYAVKDSPKKPPPAPPKPPKDDDTWWREGRRPPFYGDDGGLGFSLNDSDGNPTGEPSPLEDE